MSPDVHDDDEAPVADADSEIDLAYLRVAVDNPAAFVPFLEDIVGLIPGDPTRSGAMTWRDDDRVHRLIVDEGPANDATSLGFEVSGGTHRDRLLERLRIGGWHPTEGTADDGAERGVATVWTVRAPWGFDVDLVTALARAADPFVSPLMAGGFLTDGVGFGHVVLVTTNFEESVRFVTEGLGMVRSDWLEFELAPGLPLLVWFFHCNARHHTIALAKPPFDLPQTLHHVMFETQDRDDVGFAFDRAHAAGVPIANGLGVHDNDRMFSCYLESPAGFQVEIGHGARTVGADWDDDRRYDRVSLWGHQPLPST